MAEEYISVEGARVHNLKGITVRIPHRAITVITGPSGSGKSSLAFHTLYAEGQRRYVETFSPYTRQFLDRMPKPDVDEIRGILPAIAIEQVNAVKTSRSTVGTMTEVADYLKLLFPRMADLYGGGGRVIRPYTAQEAWEAAIKTWNGAEAVVAFEVAFPGGVDLGEAVRFVSKQGYMRFVYNGEIVRGDDERMTGWGKVKVERLRVVQDRVRLVDEQQSRGVEAVESAYHYGDGVVIFMRKGEDAVWEDLRYAADWRDAWSGERYRAPYPALFSFNHPAGACPRCRGFGRVIEIDYDLALPDRSLSIKQGVVKPFRGEQGAEWQRELLRACATRKINVDRPFNELSEAEQRFVIWGEEEADAKRRERIVRTEWPGVAGYFRWLEARTYKMHVRVLLSRYRAYRVCPDCNGVRFNAEALRYRLRHPDRALTIAEVNELPIEEAVRYFERLPVPKGDEASRRLVDEVLTRLRYLSRIGLGYLHLNRASRTLSGGEIQRVNLTACLGNSLVNTLFVLDEPTIGLHPHDCGRLIEVMRLLRDQGNTLVVVEHDEAVMRAADYVIDLGPGRGEEGGKLVVEGKPVEVVRDRGSLTAAYLRGEKKIWDQECRSAREGDGDREEDKEVIKIYGARANNLKGIDVEFPIGKMVVVSGVSGSGKSTLVHEVLARNLRRILAGVQDQLQGCERIEGGERIGEVVVVDQSPLMRTPRSNPGLYTGAFDAIRELFAMTEEAERRGLGVAAFSFNSDLGRCPHCQGTGYERVAMQFLADVWVKCPVCHGRRFQGHVLEVQYRGKSIDSVLEMTVKEAMDFFEEKVRRASARERSLRKNTVEALRGLAEVGLDYLKLGQPLNQLSGGEAQRLKLMRYLTGIGATKIDEGDEEDESLEGIESNEEKEEGKCDEGLQKQKREKRRLLILDEPTTGLHFDDVRVLVGVLRRLVERGESLVMIEHHTEVIRAADWVIDLGPGAGEQGGRVIVAGRVSDVMGCELSLTGRYLKEVRGGIEEKKVKLSKKDMASERGMKIEVVGAREHNLKNISTDFELGKMHVITGLSGSGKSTLAFDILFAEGQRRYLDSLNAYARQFVEQLSKPDVDRVTGLPPAVAVEQRISRGGAKSTVGTVTEAYHFLRLLYAKLGVPHDPETGEAAQRLSPDVLVKKVLDLLNRKRELTVLAPIVRSRKGYHTEIAQWAQRRGYPYLRVDGKWVAPNEFKKLDRYTEHTIDVVMGNVSKRQDPRENERILREALSIGRGVFYTIDNRSKELVHSRHWHCAQSGVSFDEPDPRWFSFNSPHGWCPRCEGYGLIYERKIDEESEEEFVESGREEGEICPDCLGERLNATARNVRLPLGQWDRFARYVDGKLVGRSGKVLGPRLPELLKLPVGVLVDYLKTVRLSGREARIGNDIVNEVLQRVTFMRSVGLEYLTLDRSVRALSGGEAQRITLAAQLGSNLQGVLYVLDEPTIGLHARDNDRLIQTLHRLRDAGNTLVVVEHDEEVIKAADRILDLGPGAGKEGGAIVADGDWKSISQHEDSITGRHLRCSIQHPIRGARREVPKDGAWIFLERVNKHNLREVSLKIPLRRLVVLCGVSGAGKSTLLLDVLKPLMESLGDKEQSAELPVGRIKSDLKIKRVVEVDQAPLGRTSRSTPATYLGILDVLRELFANTPVAKQRGYAPSRFSYNTKGGRCEHCAGQGQVRVAMQFLPVFYLPCEVCGGARYNADTLEVLYRGRSIADVLAMSAREAAEFFEKVPDLRVTLSLMVEVGLGYLALGQPSNTLSGGEAQRLRLVAELAQSLIMAEKMALRKTLREKLHYVYLLEEPTIGLHGEDVQRLIGLLHRLVDQGHTVIVIEHHLDMIAEGDWVIELGPGAGEAGGRVIYEGTPEGLLQKRPYTATGSYLRNVLR